MTTETTQLSKKLLDNIKNFLPSALAATVKGREDYLNIYERYLKIGDSILLAKKNEVQEKINELQAANKKLGKWWTRLLKKTPIESNDTGSANDHNRQVIWSSINKHQLISNVKRISAELKEKRDKYTIGFNMRDLIIYLSQVKLSEVKEGDIIKDITTNETTKKTIKVLRIAKNQQDTYLFQYTKPDGTTYEEDVDQSVGAVIISNYVNSQAAETKNREEVRLFLKLNEKFKNKYNKIPRAEFLTCNIARLKEEKKEYNKIQTQVKAFSDKIQKMNMNIDIEVDDELIREILICYIKGRGDGIYKVLIKRFDWIPRDIIVNLQTDLMKMIQDNNFEKKDLLEVLNITEKDLKSKSRSLSCCDGDCNDASNEAHKPGVRFAAATEIHEFKKESEPTDDAKQTYGEVVHEENFSIPQHIAHYVGEGAGLLGEGRLAANKNLKHLNVNNTISTTFWSESDAHEAKTLRRLAEIAARENNSQAIQKSSSNLKGPGASKIRNILGKFIEDVEQKIKTKWEKETGWKRVKKDYPQYEAELDELCNEMWDLMYEQFIENITIAENKEEEERKKIVKAKIDAAYNKIKEGKSVGLNQIEPLPNAMNLQPEKSVTNQAVMAHLEYNHRKDEVKRGRKQNTTNTPPWELSLQVVVAELQLPNKLQIPKKTNELLIILHDMYNLFDTMYHARSGIRDSQTIYYRNKVWKLMEQMKSTYFDIYSETIILSKKPRLPSDPPDYNPYLHPSVGQYRTGGKGKQTRKIRKGRKGKQTRKITKARKRKQTKKERKEKKIMRIGKRTKKRKKRGTIKKREKTNKKAPKE